MTGSGSDSGGNTLDVQGNDFGIGGYSSGFFFDGDIAETLVFDKELSLAERVAVENYLSSKYGLNISNPNYTADKFAHDATYGSDVAGVGQANDGSTQTTAYSSLLRVTNPRSTSNNEWLFYGHDRGGISSWSTSGAPSNDYRRLDRVWKFDETGGDVGNLDLQVDTNELPSLPSGYTRYYAIVSDDADFSTRGDQTLIPFTQANGSIYEATDLNIKDDRHFTYAIGSPAATPQNVAAKSDLNRRIEVTFDEVTDNVAGRSTTLTGDEYNVFIDSRDNGGFALGDATPLTRSSGYTISTSGGTVTANVTNDGSDDNGQGTTKIDNNTDYAVWVTAVNEVGESTESSQVQATPALKVFFSTASSKGSEKNGAGKFKVELSDTHSQDVSVDLAIAPDGQSPFDGTSLRSVSSVSIDNKGNGYADGDIIGEDDSGDGGSGLQIEVTNVGSNGEVEAVDLKNGGSGYTSAPTSFTTLSGNGSGATFTVSLQSSGSDYDLTTTTAKINSGNLTTKLDNGDLTFNDDTTPENTETVELTLSSPSTSGATASLGSQVAHDVNINDDDQDRKVFLVDDIGTADDGNTSGKEDQTVTYTLQLSSADPVNDVTVDYQIEPSEGSAESVDFTTLTGSVTIPSGDNSATFDLPVASDNTFESDEDALVRVVSATDANLDDNPTSNDPTNGRYTDLTHTIKNDDSGPIVSFKNTSTSAEEQDQTLAIAVQLDKTSSEDITVDLTKGGTASGGGTDYAFSTSSVTISAGDKTATLSPQVKEDDLDETDETLTITLSAVSAGTADIDKNADTHTHTITDDDPLPTVAFDRDAGSDREDAAGTRNVGISLSEASGRPVTVDYSKSGTATEGTDFSDGDGGSISFSPGETSKSIDLSISADKVGEKDETIDLSFSSGSITNGDAGTPSAFTFTIVNDDLGFTGPAGVGSPSTNPLWVRADSGITSSGESVSGWDDLSGNANDATAPGGSAEPSFVSGAVNGEPALSFDGTDDVLSGSSVLAGGQTGRTVITVFNPEKREDRKLVSLNYGNTGSDPGRFFTVTPEIAVRVAGGAKTYKTKPDKTYHILSTRNGRGEKVSSVETYLDGSLLDKGSGDDVLIDVKGSDFGIGGYSTCCYHQGEIAEVIVYSNELNEAQRTIIENYLSTRYALGLGSETPDIYAGSYDQALFGIGQSSGGSHPAAASGAGLRLDINSGFEAGDYVMAGHDTPSNSVNTSDVLGCCEARMDRSWELDVTNASTNATTDFTFDLSDAGLNGPAGTASDYKLIKGGQGSWSEIATASSVSGDKITFTDVDVTNRGDGVYTIATTSQTDSPLENDALALTIDGESGANEADEGWRYMGLPTTGGTAGDLEKNNGNQFINFSFNMAYTWDDANNGWNVSSSSTALPNGRGFILWIFDETNNYPVDPSITVRLPGSFSSPGDQSVTVGDNTPSADEQLSTGASKHLLANPYRVPYDLSTLGNPGGDDFKDEVQIWEADSDAGNNDPSGADDGNVGTFLKRSRSQSEKIASWQSFFLFRDGSTSGTVTFDKAGRSPGTSPGFVGSKTQSSKDQRPRQIELKLVGRNADSARIALDRAASVLFASGASEENDYFDTPKLAPPKRNFAVIGPVGTGTDGSTTIKAQESRSTLRGPIEIPLAFRSEGLSGDFTISAPQWTNVPDEWEVTLIDTKGTADESDDSRRVFKRDGPGYTFSHSGSKSAPSKSSDSEKSSSEKPRPPAVQKLSWKPQDRPSQKTSSDSSAAKQASSTRFRLMVDPQSSTLPVQMAGFSAQLEREKAVLQWETASETNNSGFYVEHQRLAPEDTSAEKGKWEKVDFVEGAGTSTEANSYRYRTESLDYGTHAFRLRQVDADGETHYSETRRIEVSLDKPFSVGNLYPNPVRDRATLQVAVKRSQEVQVRMYDVLGRQVATVFQDEVPSNTSKKIRVPGGRLTSGVYFLRVRGDDFSVTRKMTVVE